jgi:small subunit ribosomal protein S16
MSVRLRLKRIGRTNRPFYRLSAMDGRRPRDGRVLEELGTYDPANTARGEQIKLNAERIQYWLSVGAEPTDTVAQLLKQHQITAR